MIPGGFRDIFDGMEEIEYGDMSMKVRCKLSDGTILDGKVLKLDASAEPLTIALQDINTKKYTY